jgi:hypothetical protein
MVTLRFRSASADQPSISSTHGVVELLRRNGGYLVASGLRLQRDLFAEHSLPARVARGRSLHAEEHYVVKFKDIGVAKSFCRNSAKSFQEELDVLRPQTRSIRKGVLQFGCRLLRPRRALRRSSCRGAPSSNLRGEAGVTGEPQMNRLRDAWIPKGWLERRRGHRSEVFGEQKVCASCS